MHLSPYSLRQLNPACLDALDEAALRVLLGKLLEDLKLSLNIFIRRSPKQRGHSPWRYLEQAIADRRAGRGSSPPYPGSGI